MLYSLSYKIHSCNCVYVDTCIPRRLSPCLLEMFVLIFAIVYYKGDGSSSKVTLCVSLLHCLVNSACLYCHIAYLIALSPYLIACSCCSRLVIYDV